MKAQHLGAIALSINSDRASEIQLFPAGEFASVDGRPNDVDGGKWLLTAELAAIIVGEIAARKTEIVIDYEHQTLRIAENGQPAPAAGWFSEVEWREGDGLYAVNVKWTDKAASMIAAKEYRYISPVFRCNQKGEVKVLLHAALTNTPALDGMDEVMLIAASRLVSLSTEEETPTMDEEQLAMLLNQLRWLLNLPETSTSEEVCAELQKIIDGVKAGGTQAASFDLQAHLDGLSAQIESLSATQFDPEQHVPIAMYNEVNDELNQLSQQTEGSEVERLVETALTDGRLRVSQKEWAVALGQKNPDSLKTFLDKAPKVTALSQRQTDGMKKPDPTKAPALAELTPDEIALCQQLGNDPADIAKQLKD